MQLNNNFKKEIEDTINFYQPLADWFDRNQETMAYFELTHKGCLHFENSSANSDIIILGRMANAGLTWLEAPKALNIPQETKAYNASMAIAMVYEENKLNLSDDAKIKYFLDIESLKKDNPVRRNK